MPRRYTCFLCKKTIPQIYRRPIAEEHKCYAENKLGRKVQEGDVVCTSCRRKGNRMNSTQDVQTTSDTHQTDPDYVQPPSIINFKSPKSVELKIPSTPRSHKKCVVCNKPSGPRLPQVVVPSLAIAQAFVETGIFINSDSRCCKYHLDNGYFCSETLSSLQSSKETETLSRTDIASLLHNVRSLMKSSSHMNFDIPSALRDEDYKNMTGLSRDQFCDLIPYIQHMRNTSNRSVRTCLAVFLSKLRVGLSNSVLSSIFGLTISQIQRIIPSVRECLMQSFVPQYLGFHHISHDQLCNNHTTATARALFTSNRPDSNEAVLVMDGTYIYIQKSTDYSFQRKSFSLHKNRSLVKPMMVVATDGYILSVLGPYFADFHNNDANIVKHMLTNNVEDMKGWLQEDDVIIVDRGFRDSVNFLEENGFKVEMPCYLKKGSKQHSTEEANLSRLVTKVRWVVESANGRIKQWKLLDKVIANTLVPNIGDFVRIVCALCNRFKPPLATTDPESENMAQKMLAKVNLPNSVQQFVEENNLRRKRSVYKTVELASAELADFPTLTLDYLRDITMGVYQLKQSVHYSNEHLKEDGSYELLVCKDIPNLLHVKIQSRHSKSTIHLLWIQYNMQDSEPISGWYCTCKVGARVVGCCAHVASVLWYLGYQCHQDLPLAKKSLFQNCLEDAHEE